MDFDEFEEILTSYWKSGVLKAALALNIFTAVSDGHENVQEICAAIQSSERGTRAILDALVGLGLLKKKDSKYSLTDFSSDFLVKGHVLYVGNIWRSVSNDTLWESYANLTRAVKTGRPVVKSDMSVPEISYWEDQAIAAAHSPFAFLSASRLAHFLGVGETRAGMKILDLGCGAGMNCCALAQRDPTSHIVGIDWKNVIKQSRKVAQSMGVTNVEFIEGDLWKINLPKSVDIVLIGDVLHVNGPQKNNALLKRAFESLKPGGQLVVQELPIDKDRSGPLFSLLLGAGLVGTTEDADVYNFEQCKEWLDSIGFKEVLDNGNGMITAIKPNNS